MDEQQPGEGERSRTYDRAYLLSEEKRNQVMALWEVRKYGVDSYSDPDYVCIYGMKPEEWYSCGIRLLARTTVECVRDSLGDLIGRDVSDVVKHAPPAIRLVIDPFAGSCNSLYWLLRHIGDAKGVALEIDPQIFGITRRNIESLDQEIELINADYRSLLESRKVPANYLLIVFVAPPWGDALDPLTGLDMRRTKPPITEVIDDFEYAYKDNPVLFVTQTHQYIERQSLAEVEQRFDWSKLTFYNINIEGMKHGILLGTRGWKP